MTSREESPERSRVAHRRRDAPDSLRSPPIRDHDDNDDGGSARHQPSQPQRHGIVHHHHEDPSRNISSSSIATTNIISPQKKRIPPASFSEAMNMNDISIISGNNNTNYNNEQEANINSNNNHHREFDVRDITNLGSNNNNNNQINNVTGVHVSAAGTFVVSEAIVAMTIVSSSSSSSSSSVVWTADENGWIRVRDHKNPQSQGEVLKQWRLPRNNDSTSSSVKNTSMKNTTVPRVTCMWSSSSNNDNPVVMIGREDGMITVYSATLSSASSTQPPAHLGDLSLHEGLVSSIVTCSSSQQFVASCGFDGRVAVWDTTSLRCITTTKLPSSSVTTTTPLLCMTAFPTALRHQRGGGDNNSNDGGSSKSEAAWWIAIGGSSSSNNNNNENSKLSPSSAPLFVLRASDLSSVTTSGKPLMSTSPVSDSSSSSSLSSLFAMTSIVCISDSFSSASSTQTKYLWCGFSDGSISIFSASASLGVEKIQSLSLKSSASSPPTSASTSSSAAAAISHMTSLSMMGDEASKEDFESNLTIWVFSADGFLTVFDTLRRIPILRLPASVSSSQQQQQQQQQGVPSHHHHLLRLRMQQQQQQRAAAQHQQFVLTCVSPISVTKIWKLWSAAEDGTVRVWNMTTTQQHHQQQHSSSMSLTSASHNHHQPEDHTHHYNNNSSSSIFNHSSTSISSHQQQQYHNINSQSNHPVNIHEVELLRTKLLDAKDQIQQAIEREASTKKIAQLDLEDTVRSYSERLREAELSRDDAIERFNTLKHHSTETEDHLRSENRRLEDEVTRFKRRSVERAASLSQVQQQQEEQLRAERNDMIGEINTLKLQLAETKASENSASVALTISQQQLQQLQEMINNNNNNNANQGMKEESTSVMSSSGSHSHTNNHDHQQQHNQKLQDALLHQQHKLLELTQSENLLQAELRITKAELERFRDRSDATFIELDRKAGDYDKMLQATSTLRTALDEATTRATKAEQQVEFLRKELSTQHGMGSYTPIGTATTPPPVHHHHQSKLSSPSRHNNSTTTTMRPADQSLNNLTQRQDDLASLEASWQERQSHSIRELYDLRQQLERKQLDIKAVENELRTARSDIDSLRSELRNSMDETAKSERIREDGEIENERAIRDARAEERRTTEAEVSTMYRNRLVELERELQMAMDKTAKQESEIKFLQDEIRTMEKRRDATVQRDTAHVHELNKLLATNTETLKQKEIEIGKMQAEHEMTVQELRSEVLHSQKEAADQKRARESLEVAAKRQLTLVSTEMNQVDADVQQLHRQLTNGSSVMQKAQLQDELSAVREQLAQTQRELSARRAAAVQIEADRHVMETKLLAEKSEMTRIKSEFESANRQIQLQKDEMSTMQTKLQNAQRETMSVTEIAEKRAKSEVESLQQQLAASRNEVSRCNSEVDLLHKKINEQNARHSAEVIEIKSNAAKEKSELSNKLDIVERQISSGVLTQQMQSWQRRLDDASLERESQREMISTLKKQLEQAERNLMAAQTEHERNLQEQRRAIMGERNETATKISKLEMEITNKESALSQIKEQQAVHARECPLKDSNTATILAEKKRNLMQLEDVQGQVEKLTKREKSLTEELYESQKSSAEKEFEHVREMKMMKIDSENKLRDAQLQHREELQKLKMIMKAANDSSQSNFEMQQREQQPSSPNFQQIQQQQLDNMETQHQQRRRIKDLEEEVEVLQKKLRRQKEEIEELEERQKKNPTNNNSNNNGSSSSNNNNSQSSNNNSNQSQQQHPDFQIAIAKMREQSMKLQKEKAALQMQLIKRDEQLKEFETTHVNKMLEEINQLRHDRDKALLDCTRLTNDIHQLQQQLRGESQIRESLASRVDSNAAHVTTVHGSLRAVMLEAANREQFLEDQISSLQKELQRALSERSQIEESATSIETALYSTTTKSLIMVESQVAKLLSSMLLLLEHVRDRPNERLEKVMPMVVGGVETATQSVQLIRNELGFMSGGKLVPVPVPVQQRHDYQYHDHDGQENNTNNSSFQQQQQHSSQQQQSSQKRTHNVAPLRSMGTPPPQHHHNHSSNGMMMSTPSKNIQQQQSEKKNSALLSSSQLFAEAASRKQRTTK